MTQVTASLLTFQGEMDVEDDCFECVVERLIVSRDRASIQMRCRDDGDPHIAEGSFEFVNCTWQTRSFSVKYDKEKAATHATFELRAIEVSSDISLVKVQALWRQGGEDYDLEGELDRLRLR
jgi:hypothetical protein